MPLFDFFKEGPAAASPADVTVPGATAEAPAGGLDAQIEAKVTPIIEEVRPFLQGDGGDCELIKVEDSVVYVRLVGACVGCPSSLMTLRAGIENRIKEEIPEVRAVEMI